MWHYVIGFCLSIIFCLSQSVWALSVGEVLASAKMTALQASGQTVALTSFSPQGEVGTVLQARARFSDAMVRLGDVNVRNPFLVSPNCKDYGKGRWLDTKTWVYDFSDLPVGIECRFTLVSGLKSVQGKWLRAYPLYQFKTDDISFGYERSSPTNVSIIDSWPRHYQEIVDDQVFLVKLDKTTDPKTLPQHVYCLTSQSPEKLYAKFLTPQETSAWLAKQDSVLWDWWRGQKGDNYYDQASKSEKQDVVKEWRALTCGRRLVAGAEVRLVWGKHTATTTGQKRLANQVLAFKVREPFTVSFNCPRQQAKAPCVPLTDMELRFSEPIPAEKIKAIRLQGATQQWAPKPNNGDDYEDSDYVRFSAPFPAESAFLLSLPSGIYDSYGRPLSNAKNFPLSVKTGGYPPLAKFAADFGVVESAVGAVPVTVRNLEPSVSAKTEAKLYSLKIANDDQSFVNALKMYQSHGNYGLLDKPLIAKQAGVTVQPLPKQLTAREFEVIGIPVTQGLYIHEVESRYLGEWISQKPQPAFVHSMSLVTNLGVHLQMGRVGSLVWVTDLAKGQPVADATVSVWDCLNNKSLWTGQSNAQGIVLIQKDIFKEPDNPEGKKTACQYSSFVVLAQKGNDRSFVLPQWNNGIETWRYNLSATGYYDDANSDEYYGSSKTTGDYVAHTIVDRSLLRVGETVHMQHLVRMAKLVGLSAPSKELKIKKVVVEHAGSGDSYELTTQLNTIGNGESQWQIPKQAKLGEYCTRLVLQDDRNLYTSCFKVAAFRLPVLKANLGVQPNTLVDKTNPQFPMQLQLRYLNGGGYSDAPVTVRGRLEYGAVQFDKFEDYSFDSISLKPKAANDAETADSESALTEQRLRLDATGNLQTQIPLPAIDQVHTARLEMEFRDPSGETQTVGASSQVWPASVIIGTKALSTWLGDDKPIELEFVSVNAQQQLVPHTPLQITAKQIRYESHRKRTIGGYYAYDTQRVEQDLPLNCGQQTNAQGRLTCRLPLKKSGEVQIVTTATDNQGRQLSTSTSVWVGGDDDWWFDQGNDDRIDILPDQKVYQTGDTARLQVRMPFREATALVAVERDGVIDSFVTTLAGKDPIISVPIKGEYAPNVYVSALVIRGRNQEVQPTALVDLGKPAFKLGIAALKVDWQPYQLGVQVSSDKNQYRPREQAQVSVQVLAAKGRQSLPANTEVTLAVVDEALLELADNDTWEVLPTMMLERAYGMETATNQLQVVGKRHFGKKALPSGGGGGRGGATRELFDTLLLWQASKAVDTQGRVQFTVPLNDALTRFKIIAIASSKEQFGTGSHSINSRQELQVVSGLPTVVREGDQYQAEWTVRNSTEQVQTVTLMLQQTGIAQPTQHTLTLAANSSQLVTVPVTVPQGQTRIDWKASAQGQAYQDNVLVSQTVLPAIPLQVLQASLTQVNENTRTMPIAPLPANALTGGEVQVDLQASLGGTLEPIKAWFKQYPYGCLEQKTTKAAGLQDRALWDSLMADLPTYLDRDGLAQFYATQYESAGSPFLTAHILRVAKALNWPIPVDSRQKMLTALQAYVQGKLANELYKHWIFEPQFDGIQRQLEVASILAQYGTFKPTMLDNLRLEPKKWPTHLLIDYLELLQHAPNLSQRKERLAEVENLLRSKIKQMGGTYAILENDRARWWWYDSQSLLQARLILAILNQAQWQQELPLLVRGLVRQQQQGHWYSTQANLWAGFVLTRFNETSEVITGQTQLTLAAQQQRYQWPISQANDVLQQQAQQAKASAVVFDWPTNNTNLTVTHEGQGKPWLRVSTAARIPITQAMNRGYSIQKNLVPVTQKVKGEWHVGDVARVELRMDAGQDMGWVVVNDPIPAGATLLGRGLKRDSQLLNNSANDWWPVYVEYAADAYRAYYQYLPYKATWQSSYVVRFNQAGVFKLPATRVEAMYAEDVFGLSPNADIEVKP
ncbi:alpha-2-macroglobulin family protein [Agitococcus lubricus]|uniref:Alpha-2-macroglobulin family protein n=1 Tax=Agitococcus lubricus TaxID=1077255 RepID=A0A2T5J1A0_9GAMM|nr:MG2 domain-containing protein [Agitococcus lubricus]PTQ90161.1 hypothetical protein C8N29_104206 [Agitococcus lubricus]